MHRSQLGESLVVTDVDGGVDVLVPVPMTVPVPVLVLVRVRVRVRAVANAVRSRPSHCKAVQLVTESWHGYQASTPHCEHNP